MKSIYIFDSSDNEALTSYAEETEIAQDWRRFLARNGGPIYEIAQCFFCQHTVQGYVAKQFIEEQPPYRAEPQVLGSDPFQTTILILCKRCGWYRFQTHKFYVTPFLPIVVASAAVLQQKSVTDAEVPLDELRSYLARNWGDRREITAGQAEKLVADIFKEHLDGEVMYTTNGVYSPDGGIDFVIVHSGSGIEYAFQVKRRLTESPECVQNVRAFVGAIASSPYSHGYYVTTSPRFTSATVREIKSGRDRLAQRDLHIDIIDGSNLLQLLRHGRTLPTSFERINQLLGDSDTDWYEVADLTTVPLLGLSKLQMESYRHYKLFEILKGQVDR